MNRAIKELGRAFFIGVIVFIVLAIIRYFNGVIIKDPNDWIRLFVYNQVYAIVFYMANFFFFMYMLRRFKESFFKFISKYKFVSLNIEMF